MVIGHGFISLIVGKIKNIYARVFVSLSVPAFLLVFFYLAKYEYIVFPGKLIVLRVAIAYFCFIIGMLFKLINCFTLKYRKGSITECIVVFLIGLISFGLLVLLDRFNDISIARASVTTIYGFILCSLLGFIFVYSISFLLSKISVIKEVFIYLGKHTRSIVIFHMISFKIVTMLLIVLFKKEMYLLASFPTLKDAENWAWLPYLIVGLAIPLLISFCYEYLLVFFKFVVNKMVDKGRKE